MTTPIAPARSEPPTSLWVQPWPDPVVERLGHDPRSAYVEQYWLGVLGPSTTWLLRRLATLLDTRPDGFELPLRETARTLGLGMRDGRHSPFVRAIDRACQFGLCRRVDATTLQVRRRIPPVTQGQLKRLPPSVQAAHDALQRAQLRNTETANELKARRLALTLLEIGEDLDAAERQLVAWRVDPPVAQEAMRWAHTRHRDALVAAGGPDAA